jgi:Fe-S cluster biogenesis protein NfuA
MVESKSNEREDRGVTMVDKEEVSAVLDLIRPSLIADGGDVNLIDITDDGKVVVELTGACKGCPLSALTLANGIERILKERVPGVTAVVPAEEELF